MEVKIKQGKEMIDATIEVVDGVMVVSPKEVFEPKNGDVIVCSNNLGYWTLLVKRIEVHNIVYHHAVLIDNGILKFNDRSSYSNPRPATEEEKKLLFDKLAEEGYEFDFEKKELVKIKWKPKEGERYYFPFYSNCYFLSYCADVIKTDYQKALYQKCWVFKTDRECIEFCKRLNEAISQVKP